MKRLVYSRSRKKQVIPLPRPLLAHARAMGLGGSRRVRVVSLARRYIAGLRVNYAHPTIACTQYPKWLETPLPPHTPPTPL